MSEYKLQEVAKILVKNGFECVGWKGGDCRFKRGKESIHLSRHHLNDKWIDKILRKHGIEG